MIGWVESSKIKYIWILGHKTSHFLIFRHLSYRDQLKNLGLLSLRARRLRFLLIFIYKIYKGVVKLNFNDLFDVNNTRKTRGHSCHITPKFSSHNYRLHFFTVSIVSYWNQLSQDDIDTPSISAFKTKLNHFLNRFDMYCTV